MRAVAVPFLITTFIGTAWAGPALAQARGTPPARERIDRNVIVHRGDDGSGYAGDRAILGVNTTSTGRRDTLGVLISSVTPGSPAEKAGLEEGNRIAAINGVNLRLASADAGEPEMSGIASRRLTREMAKVDAGADVELRVYSSGQFRVVKVKTIAAEEMPRPNSRRRSEDAMRVSEERAVLGVRLSATGGRRDTLGVFVGQVQPDGPAEKAGLMEGDRVTSINGVDLRVSRDEAGDRWVSSAKESRFRREMAKVKAGDEVELRVYSGGQSKTLRVRSVKAADLYENEGNGMRMYFERSGTGGNFFVPSPAMAPMAPFPPMPPTRGYVRDLVRSLSDLQRLNVDLDIEQDIDVDVEIDHDVRSTSPARALRLAPVTRTSTPSALFANATAPSLAGATTTGKRSALRIPGLSLAAVTSDMAEALGCGTESGLLVVEVDDSWAPVRAGDVLLSVGGTPVLRGQSAFADLPDSGPLAVEVMRHGVRRTVTVRR